MKLILDLDTANPNAVVKALDNKPINTITTNIAWSAVERQKGRFSFEAYHSIFKTLTESGYCLNIILDAGGRLRLDKNRRAGLVSTVPTWLREEVGEPYAIDFFGDPNPNMLNISKKTTKAFVMRFYHQSLKFLSDNFHENIAFVTPGVNAELEIKYGQSSYRYLEYSAESQARFHEYQTLRGKPSIPMPKIDYGASFSGAPPRYHPYRDDLSTFRKEMLLSYVCSLTSEIRDYGFRPFGYFGGPFQPHDLIYASGIIEGATKCFDAISIDHNFYDGHKIDMRPEYVGAIVNYATHLGFKEVIIGLYVERLLLADIKADDVNSTLNNALASITPHPAIAGIEIGGFGLTHVMADTIITKNLINQADALSRVPPTTSYDIALLASFSTFELWQGEYYFKRSIHQDVLQQSYAWLFKHPEFNVRIVSEANLIDHAFSVDAIYLPHVSAPSPETVSNIERLIALGTPVIQDLRFGEFLPNGLPSKNYPLKSFGVGSIDWRTQETGFENDRCSLLKKANDFYASVAIMSSLPGYATQLTRTGDKSGIYVLGQNTLALGFIPPFTDTCRDGQAIEQIINLLNQP